MPKGRQPVVKPALIEAYGENFTQHFIDNFKDKTLNEVFEIVSKDTNNAFTSMALYTFVRQHMSDFSFKSSGKRGRKSTLIPKLIEHYGSERKLVETLKAFSHLTDKEATERIAEDTGLTISSIQSQVGNRYEVEFHKKWTKRTKEEMAADPESEVRGPVIPVHLKCKDCEDEKTIGVPLATITSLVKGRRCNNCKSWDSYVATFSIDGEEKRIAVMEHDLGNGITIHRECQINSDMEALEVPSETVVEENHEQETETERECQTA